MVEVNVEPDGSTTFEGAADDAGGAEGAEEGFDEEIPLMEEVVATGVDPAIYLLVAFVVGAALYFLYLRKQRSNEEDYFSSYEKVSMLCTMLCTVLYCAVLYCILEKDNTYGIANNEWIVFLL